MKQFWLSGLLFLFSFAYSNAQAEWQISGYIRSASGEPLPGSLAQINDTNGMVADSNGYFSILSAQRPAELIVRCMGYFPQRILLRDSDFVGKKTRIEVALTTQETVLREVSISARKVEVLAKENFSTDIYDYAFAGDNLLLLMRERKRYFVRLVSESGEKLDEIRLDWQATLLHRSCTGSLHLAGSNHAQELTLIGTRLDTFPRYPILKFRQFVEPCVQQNLGHYYFKVSGLFNKSVTYVYFDPDRNRHLLAVIRDAGGEAEAMDAYHDFRSGAPLFVRSTGGMPALPGINDGFSALDPGKPANAYNDAALQHYANSNEQLAHWSWLQMLKMDSVYAPLLKIGDTLLLFDHVAGRMYRFEVPPLSSAAVTSLQYHKAEGWQRELLEDEARQMVYAHFAPGRRHLLRRIDTRTGETGVALPLPDVPLIAEKFKMRNGFLYFLGHPDPNVPNAGLYKVNIFQKNATK